MSAAKTGFAAVLRRVVRVLSADMLKVIQAAHNHFATGGGAVVLEHVEQCLEEQTKIGVGETGAFSEGGRDVAFGRVEGVGDYVLVAHGALLLCVFLLRHGATGDGDFQRGDGVERLTKGELDWAAHLAESGAFHHAVTGGQNAAEGTDIKELATKPILGALSIRVARNFGVLLYGLVFSFLLFRFDDGTLFDQDFEVVGISSSASRRKQFDEVTHLPLEANVGNDAAIGIGIKTRQVAGIGVAIGVAVGDFKQEEEVVAVCQDVVAHRFILSLGIELLVFSFGFGVVVLSAGLARSSVRCHLLIKAEGESALGLKVKNAREGWWSTDLGGFEQD